MSTITVSNIKKTGETASRDVSGVAAAWVSFTPAAATVLDSMNVASLVDNGTGDTTVNFTSAMANGDYVEVSEAANVASAVVLADMRCRLRSIADRTAASTRLSTGDNDAVKNFTLSDLWSSATVIHGDLA
jgi:hypothetical protein